MKKLFILFALIPTFVFAKKASQHKSLQSLVEKVSKLTKVTYATNEKLKGSYWVSESFKLTKENAEHFLSLALNDNNYTRLNHPNGMIQIISTRDVRYYPTNKVTANKTTPPKVKESYDYQMMEYKLNYGNLSTELTRALRPFMSRYGRIIDFKTQGTLLIQDTGFNLKRLYGIIKTFDSPTPENIKEYLEEDREFKQRLQLLEAKHKPGCPSPKKPVPSMGPFPKKKTNRL